MPPSDDPLVTFFLTCLQPQADGQAYQGGQDLSPDDWQAVVRLAARHDLRPYFYQRLMDLELEPLLPARLREDLRMAYLRSARDGILLNQELGELLAAFAQAGIAVIPLKGAYLAEQIYTNLALRPMHDLDLLVSQTDLAGAARLLAGRGYAPQRPYQLEQEQAASQHLPPYQPPGGRLVELHWAILPPHAPFSLEPAGLWQRSQAGVLAGQPCRQLDPADLLLHLILHASYQHAFGLGLSPLLDITWVISHFQERLDWEAFLALVNAGGFERCAYLTLQAARDLLRAPISADALATLLSADLPAGYQALVEEHLLAGVAVLTPNLSELLEPDSLPYKARRFLRRVFIPRALLLRQFDLPEDEPRLWRYYLLRLRFLLPNLPAALRLLGGDEATRRAAERQNRILEIQRWLGGPEKT